VALVAQTPTRLCPCRPSKIAITLSSLHLLSSPSSRNVALSTAASGAEDTDLADTWHAWHVTRRKTHALLLERHGLRQKEDSKEDSWRKCNKQVLEGWQVSCLQCT
jgi:hypothetical protein